MGREGAGGVVAGAAVDVDHPEEAGEVDAVDVHRGDLPLGDRLGDAAPGEHRDPHSRRHRGDDRAHAGELDAQVELGEGDPEPLLDESTAPRPRLPGDERRLEEVLAADVTALGEGMVVGADDHHLVAGIGELDEVADAGERALDEGDVELAGEHRVLDLAGVLHPHRDSHLGMGAQVVGEHQ